MIYQSIVEKIFHIADLTPNANAIIYDNKKISYWELTSKILAAKEYFINKFKIKEGDRIILSANKDPGFIFAYFGAHLCGAIVVPIDPEINKDRFQFIFEKTKPSVIVGLSKIGEQFSNLIDISIFHNLNYDLNTTNLIDFPESDEIADIIFTTGTTGQAKGVMLSHKNITAAATNINAFIGNNQNDIEILALPISHSFGLGRLRCVLHSGGTMILLGSFANVKKLFREIELNAVTGMAMVPSSWLYIKRMSGQRIANFANQLKYLEIGSAPMELEDKILLTDLLPNTKICMHYGLTEASRSTFIEFHSQKEYINSIGKATPPISVVIMNETGVILPTNSEGEICVKGNTVSLGYWEDPFLTLKSQSDGYFRTGDWGSIDNQGFIHLKSRKKDLINVGGKKVSPVEIESVIIAISEIKECACIGIPDPKGLLGEVVKAFLVKEENSEFSFDYVKKQIEGKLEFYKMPVAFEWIDEIPKTSNGKIQRHLLKQ